jgi:hypothetical protein
MFANFIPESHINNLKFYSAYVRVVHLGIYLLKQKIMYQNHNKPDVCMYIVGSWYLYS